MESRFQPPARGLTFIDGVWTALGGQEVSYPDDGNDVCLAIEESSFWFKHRNRFLLAALAEFPPSGFIYDVGGGNGFQAMAFEEAGYSTVLVEPGAGARNAMRRGLERVIQATFDSVDFPEDSLDAIGCFDVLEHIEDDRRQVARFLRSLRPGGRLYVTVPAGPALWSGEDVAAGHYRRYTKGTLGKLLVQSGFRLEFLTPFFTWLGVPLFAFRTLPFRLRGGRGEPSRSADQHKLPAFLSPFADLVHRAEIRAVANNTPLPFGTSLLAVARKFGDEDK